MKIECPLCGRRVKVTKRGKVGDHSSQNVIMGKGFSARVPGLSGYRTPKCQAAGLQLIESEEVR